MLHQACSGSAHVPSLVLHQAAYVYHQAASARLELYQAASMCLQAASARLELYQATPVCHLRLSFLFLQVPWPNGRGITNAPYGMYLAYRPSDSHP